MLNIFRTGRHTNFKVVTDGARTPASATSTVTSKVKGQGRKVTWRVWWVLADKSRTKRPRNTKIGRTVAHPTGNNAQQFQGQRRSTKTRIADKRRHQDSYCWDRNCIISTEREDLQTSELVPQWSMRCQLLRPAIKLWSWVLACGRGHTVSAAPGGACYR